METVGIAERVTLDRVHLEKLEKELNSLRKNVRSLLVERSHLEQTVRNLSRELAKDRARSQELEAVLRSLGIHSP